MQLIQTLTTRGLLNDADRTRAADMIKSNPDIPPHQILIDKGFVREEAILPVLAEEFGLELIDLSHAKIAPDVLSAMPQKLVHRKNLMPVARNNGTLVVATADPFDAYALDETANSHRLPRDAGAGPAPRNHPTHQAKFRRRR